MKTTRRGQEELTFLSLLKALADGARYYAQHAITYAPPTMKYLGKDLMKMMKPKAPTTLLKFERRPHEEELVKLMIEEEELDRIPYERLTIEGILTLLESTDDYAIKVWSLEDPSNERVITTTGEELMKAAHEMPRFSEWVLCRRKPFITRMDYLTSFTAQAYDHMDLLKQGEDRHRREIS